MKIGIAGNYGNDNQGDESVLEGIITQLEDTFEIERKDILVFTNNREQTEQRYGTATAPLFIYRKTDPMKFFATLLHHRKVFKTLDLLLIGGGGIMMDLFRSAPFVYGIYGILAKWTKTPAAIFGVGVGPIQTSIGKRMIKMIGNAVDLVTVRDHVSKQMMMDIGVKTPTTVILDPAFYIPFEKEKTSNKEGIQIGVTALPYFHDSYWPTRDDATYHGYIEGMAANLDHILEQEPNGWIQFYSTKHPSDTKATKDIQQYMKHQDRTSVRDERLTHQEIIHLSAELDLVIGTRLHSLILSIVAKTPVIAVGYHDKVRDVMKTVHCTENTLTISQVSEDHRCMLPIYETMRHDWKAVENKFDGLIDQVIQESPDGMEMIQQDLTDSLD